MLLKIHCNTKMLNSGPCEPYLAGRVVSKAPRKKIHQKYTITMFLCHGPLCFSTIPPLLPLSPQNPLDHVSELCRP